jgi:hypothetical protein
MCEFQGFQLTSVKSGKRIEAEGEIYGFQNTLKNVRSYQYYPQWRGRREYAALGA